MTDVGPFTVELLGLDCEFGPRGEGLGGVKKPLLKPPNPVLDFSLTALLTAGFGSAITGTGRGSNSPPTCFEGKGKSTPPMALVA